MELRIRNQEKDGFIGEGKYRLLALQKHKN